ncbi:MAG: hypothetical protein Dbin4_02896 [Alphaproteobacteria bacterium]|nr:hypothetical protein [Alphaproteobacteria bacterium]
MFKKILLGSVMAAAAATGANAVVIDDFTAAPQSISIGGPLDGAPCIVDVPLGNTCAPDGDDSSIAGGVSAPVPKTVLDNEATPGAGVGASQLSILGGYRDITTTLIQSPDSTRTTDADSAIINGEFSHSQEAGVSSNSYITWDGLAGGTGLNANLSAFTDFHLIVLSADAGVDWSLQLFDENGVSAIHEFSNLVAITTPTHLYLPFALFAGFDFTEVDKIIFGANINSEVDFDTQVALIEAVVPEPASLTLLGAGIMGLGYFGKRRRA